MLENCQYVGEISIEIRKGNGIELPLDAQIDLKHMIERNRDILLSLHSNN
jgi:hypothetical protein